MSVIPAGYPSRQKEAQALLATRSKLCADDLKIIALLELSGEAFYAQAADAVDNEEAKTLLNRNGQEERGHAHRLLKAIKLLGDDYQLPEHKDNPFVRPVNLKGLVNAQLLATVKQAEIDGDRQYQAWADAESNEEVAKIYRQNGSEEIRHSERIAQLEQLLT